MEARKKQNLIIIVAIIIIVLGFTVSNYIKEQKVYVLSGGQETTFEEAIGDKESIIDYSSENRIKDDVNTEKIVVHIEGEILSPGVYELNGDSRVFDAIDVAGGLLDEADRTKINLAKKIMDEEYIYIPNKNDEDVEVQYRNNLSMTSGTIENTNLININKANIIELKELSGIGDVLADRIIEYRNEKGQFKSIEELKNVNGIGDKKFNDIKDQVTIR